MEPTLDGAMALARSATGPLSPHIPAFVASLIDQRYAVTCVRAKAWRSVAFDAWLAKEEVDLVEVTDAHIGSFHRRPYRPRSDCRSWPLLHEVAALRQLLRYLRERGLVAAAPLRTSAAGSLVASFEEFLLRDRGLTATTVRGYRTPVRDFLTHRFGSEVIDLGSLQASDVQGFVQHCARRLRPRALKRVVSALRAFLRYADIAALSTPH